MGETPKIGLLHQERQGRKEKKEKKGKQFRGNDRIQSPTFPELSLTAQQIFSASY